MKIGPKFKIAKRLGAPVFEKTQTQKFALSEARTAKNKKRGRGTTSDYSRQLTEKQKMRYTYGITESQLARYVDEAVTTGHQPIATLLARLEMRLDDTVYRLGLAKTRLMARQMVSHGHILVNGKRLDIASHKVKVGDVLSVREGSRTSGLYTTFETDHVASGVPAWLTMDAKELKGEVKAEPSIEPSETLFDPKLVLEYYSR